MFCEMMCQIGKLVFGIWIVLLGWHLYQKGSKLATPAEFRAWQEILLEIL